MYSILSLVVGISTTYLYRVSVISAISEWKILLDVLFDSLHGVQLLSVNSSINSTINRLTSSILYQYYFSLHVTSTGLVLDFRYQTQASIKGLKINIIICGVT